MIVKIILLVLACSSCEAGSDALTYDCSKRSMFEKLMPVCDGTNYAFCKYGCPEDKE
jgi:hypothetical protein